MSAAPVLHRLHDVAAINPPLDSRLHLDAKVCFVPMAAVDADASTVLRMAERTYAEVSKGYTPFMSGDVLVAKITPCFENGKIAQAVLPTRNGFGSTEFHVLRARDDRLNARYLLHFLRRSEIRSAGERRMTGSAGQRRVPESFLSELKIPLPSLEEQRQIAAILDQADALRARRRGARALVNELSDAVFVEMFGDLVTNERRWPETAMLGEVADMVSGVTKGRKINGAKVRSVPYLAVANVQDKAIKLDAVKTIEATEEEIRRYRLCRDDLLLTEGGDPDKLGRGSLWQGELSECIHQNHVFRVRLKSELVTPLFLNWQIGSQRGKNYFLRSAKQTTGIASINMTQLRGFPLLVPPRALQEEFGRRMAEIEALRGRLDVATDEQEALLGSLQHRVFSGQL